MARQLLLIVAATIVAVISMTVAAGQTSRASVSGAEVTGTFSHGFTGKFKGSASEIKILALGKGKLKVAFDLIYPFVDGAGELEANMGQLDGEADISGDTAVLKTTEFGPCTITIKFVRPGGIKVTQNGSDGDCGFGHNVSAEGSYKKTSGAKPKFDTR
ncbi:MAG: hypothetical protein ABI999_04895 [Acidobacteriota bacterium]